jgi:putative ABC transport system substrate-binding protein
VIDRRRFIGGVACAFFPAPLVAEAQRTTRVPRVGVLGVQSREGSPPILALGQELRELGYVEGQNIAIDWRWAQGRNERFLELAAELVQLRVDVIVAATNPAVQAAQKATRTIPIVMAFVGDPVALGFVSTLGRPGGNITGLAASAPEIAGKRLQLLREVAPNLGRIAVLNDPRESGTQEQRAWRETEAAAKALGVQLHVVDVRSDGELDRAFSAITRDRADAVNIRPSSMFFVSRARIAQLAATHRLPSMAVVREYPEAGCLMSYGTKLPAVARRAAHFVDKILKGARPSDLPVELPTEFELVINVKTAKALGLTIPPSLLGRADQVIE